MGKLEKQLVQLGKELDKIDADSVDGATLDRIGDRLGDLEEAGATETQLEPLDDKLQQLQTSRADKAEHSKHTGAKANSTSSNQKQTNDQAPFVKVAQPSSTLVDRLSRLDGLSPQTSPARSDANASDLELEGENSLSFLTDAGFTEKQMQSAFEKSASFRNSGAPEELRDWLAAAGFTTKQLQSALHVCEAEEVETVDCLKILIAPDGTYHRPSNSGGAVHEADHRCGFTRVAHAKIVTAMGAQVCTCTYIYVLNL
jgi:hypothetical protein